MEKEKIIELLIHQSTPLKNAIQILHKTGERILFVIDKEEKILGTVTDGDIRSSILNGMSFADPIELIICKEYNRIDLGSKDIFFQAKNIMISEKILQVPVIDDNERIHDVIMWTDILGVENKKKITEFYNNIVVIMAGGEGKRLDPFTKILPKPLIPIGDKTVIEHIMDRFHKYGFKNFLYTLNYKKEYIKIFLKEHKFPYNIQYVEEDQYLGTAGSLSLLSNFVHDSFFVINCDTLIDVDFLEVLKWHKEKKALLTIVGAHNELQIPFGVLAFKNGILEKIDEKPSHDMVVNTGMYIMEPEIISQIDSDKKIDMTELVNKFAKLGMVTVYPVSSNTWTDVGQWNEYINTLQNFERRNFFIA